MFTRRLWTAALAVALAVAVGAAPAAAQRRTTTSGGNTTGIDALKQRAHNEISRRLSAIDAASQVVGKSYYLEGDRDKLSNTILQWVSGLQGLDAKIGQDTTDAEVRADTARIFTDFRVFALDLPVVHLVRAVDAIDFLVDPRLKAIATKLETQATQRGKSAAVQPLVDDLRAKVNAASQIVTGMSAQLQALKPSDYNANHNVLSPYRSSLEQARTDVKAARADAERAVTALGQ